MKIKSIKNKILFYYSLILFLIISAFSFSLYFTIKYNMKNNLSKKIHQIEDEIIYFIEDDLPVLIEKINSKNKNFIYKADPDLIIYDNRNKEYKLNNVHENDIKDFFIEIKDFKSNKTIIKSINMKNNSFKAFNKILDKKQREIKIDFISKDSLTIYKSELVNKRFSIHIAKPLDETQKQLNDLLYITLFFSFILFIVTFILSSYLIKRVIKPMKDILLNTKELKASDLSKRLETPNTNDEFEELAITFNSMFDEIENSFNKLKRFNSEASHELKTPLTIISGEIEVLLKKERSNEEYKKALKSIFEETHSLKNIVNTLLLITSVDNKELVKKFKNLDISHLLLKSYEEQFFIAQEKKILLDLNSVDIVKLNCDEVLIKSMFNNIIDNAIKYSQNHTKITIDLKEDDKNINFIVKDEGIGLKKEEKKLIFDRFYRSDKSHNKTIKGYGLGLAIVKSIVSLHNGKIDIYDNKPKGSIFHIRLKKDNFEESTQI